jgi:hypothetical protein
MARKKFSVWSIFKSPAARWDADCDREKRGANRQEIVHAAVGAGPVDASYKAVDVVKAS